MVIRDGGYQKLMGMGVFCGFLYGACGLQVAEASCWTDLQKLESQPLLVAEFARRYVPELDRGLIISENLPAPVLRKLQDAMNYSAGNGKRIRPLVMFALAEALGIPVRHLYPAALAVEYLHAASLVTDDLPAQDDDDTRRGRPAVHIAFGEATAQLAIIALIAKAYEQLPRLGISKGGAYPDANVLELFTYVSKSIGLTGLSGGQLIDLDRSHRIASIDQLRVATYLKTGLAFEASLFPAFILLGEPESRRAIALKEFSRELGIVFQARDDWLGVNGSSRSIGKTSGIDEKNGTTTYISFLGSDGTLEEIAGATFRALEHLKNAGVSTELLRSSVILLAKREK